MEFVVEKPKGRNLRFYRSTFKNYCINKVTTKLKTRSTENWTATTFTLITTPTTISTTTTTTTKTICVTQEDYHQIASEPICDDEEDCFEATSTTTKDPRDDYMTESLATSLATSAADSEKDSATIFTKVWVDNSELRLHYFYEKYKPEIKILTPHPPELPFLLPFQSLAQLQQQPVNQLSMKQSSTSLLLNRFSLEKIQ